MPTNLKPAATLFVRDDDEGLFSRDINGQSTPRYNTIYDAALKLHGDEAKTRIPTLCHLPHMTPVAVCRICLVQIYRQVVEKEGKPPKRKKERKLLPACHQRVE